MKKTVLKLAARNKRFIAGIIDYVFPTIIGLILLVMSNALITASLYYDYGYYGYGGYNAAGASVGVILFMMILLLVYLGVEIYFYARSQSIGKAIVGLKVVSSVNGKPLDFWHMMLREFIVKGASQSVLYLGYIWILIDDKNRGWHDKILDTYVIDIRETEAINNPAPSGEVVINSAPEAPAQPEAPIQPAEPDIPEAPAQLEVSGQPAECEGNAAE